MIESPHWVTVPVRRPPWGLLAELNEAIRPIGAAIACGFARYCCSPNMNPGPAAFGDVDVLCPTPDIFRDAVAVVAKLGLIEMVDTSRATSYQSPSVELPVVQLIKPTFPGGTIEESLDYFDFTVCRVALLNQTEGIAHHQFLLHESYQSLVYLGSPFVAGSFRRLNSYGRKGYTASMRTVVKMLAEWDSLSQKYKNELIEDAIEKGGRS